MFLDGPDSRPGEAVHIVFAGEKVKALINEHLISLGINPKVPPVELLAEDFLQRLLGLTPVVQDTQANAEEFRTGLPVEDVERSPILHRGAHNQLCDVLRGHPCERYDLTGKGATSVAVLSDGAKTANRISMTVDIGFGTT